LELYIHSLNAPSWRGVQLKHRDNFSFYFYLYLEGEERDCWFQKGGARVHNANSTMDMLQEFFGDHIISQNLWSPRSLDLSSPDFYRGFLKDNV